MRVIFVCAGNTCRSPFAEGYFNSLKLKGITAESRGLSAFGMPVSKNSAQIALRYGFDISSHLSTVFCSDDLSADHIFTMNDEIRDFLIKNGADENRVKTLGGGIPDPYGQDITVYAAYLKKIADEIDKLVFDGFFDGMKIVLLQDKHIPFIAETEKENFSEPWSEKSILESSQRNTVFFVAERDDRPVGYAGLYHCLDEGYITSIAVTDDHRKTGVASKLIDRLISFARENGLNFISLEVRKSNESAISLYKKFGFKNEGERKRFYRDPTEDALIMTRRF